MKALAIGLILVCSTAYAQDDAPRLTPPFRVDAARLIVNGAEVDVGPGLYLESDTAIALGREIAVIQEEKKALQAEVKLAYDKVLPPWVIAAIVAVSLGVGVGAGIVIKGNQ